MEYEFGNISHISAIDYDGYYHKANLSTAANISNNQLNAPNNSLNVKATKDLNTNLNISSIGKITADQIKYYKMMIYQPMINANCSMV